MDYKCKWTQDLLRMNHTGTSTLVRPAEKHMSTKEKTEQVWNSLCPGATAAAAAADDDDDDDNDDKCCDDVRAS